MAAVADGFAVHIAFHDSAQDGRLMLVEQAHSVAHMGANGGTLGNGAHCLIVGCAGVTDANHNAQFLQGGDHVLNTFQFGRDGDVADIALCQLLITLYQRNIVLLQQMLGHSQALAAGDHVAIVTDHNGHTPEGYANMSVLAPLTSEYYTTQHWYKSPSCSWGRINAISAQCEDIETMVKWFDAWYAPATDPLNAEGTLYAITPWLGEIGVDHALDEATGIYTELAHEGIEMGKFLASESFQIALYSGYEGGLFPFSSAPTNGVGVKGQGTINNLWPYAETPFDLNSLVLTEDESDTYNDAWTDINAYIVESTAKFITGEADIAAEWDNYVKALEQMGLQDVIDVYQAAYDRAQ